MPSNISKKTLPYDRTRPAPNLRFCRNDVYVLAGVLLLSLLSAVYVIQSSFVSENTSQTLFAVVTVEGTEVCRFSLSSREHQSFLVRTPDGNLLVEAVNGQASIVESDCPDQICVHTGSISKPGRSSVCLPFKTVLRIEAAENSQSESRNGSSSANESVDAISE